MITTVSRYEFGFRDDNFEGYVFVKDESYPVAQLHLYGDYYTFFWRGGVDFQGTVQCLGGVVNEVSRRKSMPLKDLAEGTAWYGLAGSTRSLLVTPYWLRTEYRSEEAVYSVFYDTNQMVATDGATFNFVRFDVESGSLRQPIILWADLSDVAESEIGFSTLDDLPISVLQLFQRTSHVEISSSELDEISGQVTNNLCVPA